MKKIDLSYKDDAENWAYDIECLPSLFTSTFWNNDTAILWFFGSKAYDSVTDEELISAFTDYLKDPYHLEVVGLDSSYKPKVKLVRWHEGDPTIKTGMRKAIRDFMYCKSLTTSKFTNYASWNGASYDLLVLILINNILSSKNVDTSEITTQNIRKLSDAVINFDGAPWKFAEYIENYFPLNSPLHMLKSNYTLDYNTSIWYDGHIDVAKMRRSNEDGEEQKFPPALKIQEARRGMDIIADDNVSNDDPNYIMSKTELLNFVKYNLNDVFITWFEFKTRSTQEQILVRDEVRKMHPHTSARATKIIDLAKGKAPLERDCTEASLTASALAGEDGVKFIDSPAVDYAFPVPDKEQDGEFKQVDMLEYMKKTERIMPDDMYRFFSFWRGQNTSSKKDLWEAKNKAIKLHVARIGTAINVPYLHEVEDGLFAPIDAYIRFSTGGAHGSVYAGLHKMTPKQIHSWALTDKKPSKKQMKALIPTLDLKNIIHLDFTSYYPYLIMKMGIFVGSDGVDRYVQIYEERVKVKQWLAQFRDKSKWTYEQWAANDKQLGLKLQLNAGSGAANMHSKYALLPLDNKILSMRLIGNMAIWCLAQRVVHAGGYIVSTNTDGIYVANISLETVNEVLDGFVKDYGILVDPEVCDRFINRDTSNRLELIADGDKWKANDVRGQLRSANKLVFNDTDNAHSITYPLAVGNAVVRYMVDDPDWLMKPYSRERMMDILNTIKSESTAISWVQIHKGTAVRKLVIDDTEMQKVNRVVLTKNGWKLSENKRNSVTKTMLSEVAQADDKDTSINKLSGGEFGVNDVSFACKQIARSRHESDKFTSVNFGKLDEEHLNKCYEKGSDKVVMVARNKRGKIEEFKPWSNGVVNGYPNNARGDELNSAYDLRNFDLNRLDMEQYCEWAENILSTWKGGATIDENGYLHVVQFDDKLDHTAAKTLTNKATVDTMVNDIYDMALGMKERENV